MELRHLKYFVAIAEEGSLNRAAARLHLAQPALSRQLRNLEEELGDTLCERTPAGITLTEAGQLLLKRARLILRDVERAVEDVQALNQEPAPTLSLGFLGNYHLHHLKPALDRLRERHPALKLSFLQGMQSEQLQALRNGELDLAFINLPAPLDALPHEVVMRVPLVIVLPENHRLLKRKSLRLQDLHGEDFVFSDRKSRPEFYDLVHGQFKASGIQPNMVREIGGPLDGVVGLVRLGLGLSILPIYPDAPRAYQVAWRPFRKPQPWIEFALVWRRGDVSPLVQELREHIAALVPATLAVTSS